MENHTRSPKFSIDKKKLKKTVNYFHTEVGKRGIKSQRNKNKKLQLKIRVIRQEATLFIPHFYPGFSFMICSPKQISTTKSHSPQNAKASPGENHGLSEQVKEHYSKGMWFYMCQSSYSAKDQLFDSEQWVLWYK